ncbi:SsrA-binding protein [bacterium]|jgi:SsrA-binding protein|nr:SsrA-binding protein [bacterium]MDP6571566.1 SsrA-binding protein SmpB [Patescibacteria group bacterium]MDP6756141.1 SsrA-binding protein SmpB [Patescibacteria group bacterium]|tara:strand:- start:2137 stop:2595 length:459 start_codon:yes stop_codon:yes gene_type:complete
MKGKLLAKNKSAFAEYTILDTFEAGIKLTGPEVKSIKLGNIKLKGSYSTINPNTGVLWLVGAHIGAYKPAASVQIDYDPTQSRTLLLNKKEISSLIGKLKEKQLTLIPLSVYSKSGIIKVELGLGRGKKKFEKREQIKKRDIERDIGRKLKS